MMCSVMRGGPTPSALQELSCSQVRSGRAIIVDETRRGRVARAPRQDYGRGRATSSVGCRRM
eukprot:15470711-Alexandrium_andersonii.AAC.1